MVGSTKIVKSNFGLAIAGVAAFGMFVVGAAPANAVTPTLPSNQHMFVIDCDSGHGYLWSVNPATGMSTAVGSANPTHTCTAGAQQNPIDGKVYVAWTLNNSAQMLSTLDTETGEYTDIGEIHGDTAYIQWLMITNSGEAYGTKLNGDPMYGLDLSTGLTTVIGNPGIDVSSMAYNPSDDAIYAYTWGGEAYRINKETGAATALPDHNVELSSPFNCADGSPQNTTDVYGGTFDSNGNAWLLSDNCNQLLAVDFSTGEATGQGYFHDASESITPAPNYVVQPDGTIFMTTDSAGGVGSESLAKTGANNGSAGGAIVLGGLALAMGLIVRRRARS